jgi:hypothetical protein
MTYDVKKKNVYVDWDSYSSIEKAERLKSKLENSGYILVGTKKTGFDKDKLIYEKKEKK